MLQLAKFSRDLKKLGFTICRNGAIGRPRMPNEMKKRTSSKPNACFVLKRRRARNWPKAELKSLKDKQKDSPRYIQKKIQICASLQFVFPCLGFAF
jgi:hypothetical protein